MKYMKIALLPCCKLIFVTKSKLHNSSQKILTTSNLGIIYFLSFFSAETILLAIPSVSYNWINKRPLSLLDNTHLLSRHTLNWIGDLPLPQDTISPHYKDSCILIINELKLKVNCRIKLGLVWQFIQQSFGNFLQQFNLFTLAIQFLYTWSGP